MRRIDPIYQKLVEQLGEWVGNESLLRGQQRLSPLIAGGFWYVKNSEDIPKHSSKNYEIF